MDLAIQITGQVVSSNFDKYEKLALARIEQFNLSPEKPEEFGQCKEDIKYCKEIETKLAQAKQDAIHKMADISALMTSLDKLNDKHRNPRLAMEKLVNTEEARIKQEAITEGIRRIREACEDSTVPTSVFQEDDKAVNLAAKGKRTGKTLTDAIDAEVTRQIDALKAMQEIYIKNTAAVEKAQQEYPGLFPDKITLCGKPVDEVTAIIQSRIDSFKLAEIEKKRLADEKDAEEKRCAEYFEKTEDESIPEPAPEPIKNEPLTTAPSSQAVYSNFAITVNVNCTQSKAIELAKNVKALVVAEIPAATVNLKSV